MFNAPETYLSHRAPLMLLSRVEKIERDQVMCVTSLDASSPLAPFIEADGRIGNEWLIELMAQTVAVWAGSEGKATHDEAQKGTLAPIGLLLSVRQAKFKVASLAKQGELIISMHRLLQDGQLATFSGTVVYESQTIAEAKITVYQPLMSELSLVLGKSSE